MEERQKIDGLENDQLKVMASEERGVPHELGRKTEVPKLGEVGRHSDGCRPGKNCRIRDHSLSRSKPSSLESTKTTAERMAFGSSSAIPIERASRCPVDGGKRCYRAIGGGWWR